MATIRRWLVILLLLIPVVVHGATQVRSALPNPRAATFNSAVTTSGSSMYFDANEDALRYNDQFPPFVVSGATAPTSGTLAHTIAAVTGYVNGYYVSQDATAHTYTASRRTYVYADHLDTRSPEVSFSAGTGCTFQSRATRLIFAECSADSGAPTSSVLIMPLAAVDTSGTAITVVTDLRALGGAQGVTYADAYTTLQGAIDAATATGTRVGIVELSNRVYIFDTGLVMYPGTHLVGPGGLGKMTASGTVRKGPELIYTGAEKAITLTGSGITDFSSTLRNFSLLSTTGTDGIFLFDAAKVNIENIAIYGRMATGITPTGFSNACIHLSGTFPGGASFNIQIHNSVLQTCAGDGIEAAEVNNINQISIHQTVIQGNLGWGINKNVIGSSWSVSGSDIEGNSLGNVFDRGCRGCSYTGNHFEMGSPVESVVVFRGGGAGEGQLFFAGNWVYGSESTNCVELGDATEVSGIVVEGNFIGACDVGVLETAAANSRIANNHYFSIDEATQVVRTTASDGTSLVRPGDTPVVRIDTTHQTGLANDSSTAEEDMYSRTIKALELTTGGMLRVKWAGQFLNNSGGPVDYTIRLYWGAQVLIAFPFAAVATEASTRVWICEANLIGNPSSLVRVDYNAWCKLSTLGGVSANAVDWYKEMMVVSGDTTAEDYSDAQVLKLTQQNSVSSAQISGELRSVSIEKLEE
jgi:hypothetical protein